MTYIRESETFNKVVAKSHIDAIRETKAILGIRLFEIVPASLYESIQTGYEEQCLGLAL